MYGLIDIWSHVDRLLGYVRLTHIQREKIHIYHIYVGLAPINIGAEHIEGCRGRYPTVCYG